MLKPHRVAIAALVAFMAFAPNASAHTITRSDCLSVAMRQPPGQRFPVYAKCLRFAQAHNLAHVCRPPRPLVSRAIRVKGKRADSHQRQMVTRILNEGRRNHASRNVMVASIAAATQESSITNLDHGDSSSVGLFQLISDHGSHAWRMVPENSAGWFFRGAAKLRGSGRLHPGAVADAVERPARRGLYDRWVPEARKTVGLFLGICPR